MTKKEKKCILISYASNQYLIDLFKLREIGNTSPHQEKRKAGLKKVRKLIRLMLQIYINLFFNSKVIFGTQ